MSWHLQICDLIGSLVSELEQQTFHKISVMASLTVGKMAAVHYGKLIHAMDTNLHENPFLICRPTEHCMENPLFQ